MDHFGRRRRHGSGDGSTEGGPGGESRRLHADDDDLAGRAAERAGQAEGVAQPQRVRGEGAGRRLRSGVEVEAGPGEGCACTEAPRGLLYHRYRLDGDGTVVEATIVPPTSQNQLAIEADIRRLVERSLDLPDAELAHLCERGVRNHDPCISCATHFLRLDLERGDELEG